MNPFETLDPVSPQALAIAHLFMALLLIMAGVFLLVAAWLVVNIVRFRARPGMPDPEQYYGTPRAEFFFIGIPALLVVVIFGVTLRTMGEADPPIFAGDVSAPVKTQASRPDIIVIGHQFYWEIKYPGTTVDTANELHLPVGRPMRVELQSVDVIHSLSIPQLNGHVDAIPGQVNEMWLEADKAGVYDGRCQEYCGTAHAWMEIQAIAQPAAQFNAWLKQQEQAATPPTSGPAAEGYQLFMGGTCRNCHAIAGTPANADIGPNLTHFASRGILAGGVLTNSRENVARWLKNPQAVKPGNHMPNFDLSDQQVQILTAYLETLR
jgi:cytochrome c oxidase subunit 2